MKRLLGLPVFIIVFSLNAFVFFQRTLEEEGAALQLPALQVDDRLFKHAMQERKKCCNEKKQRFLSSTEETEASSLNIESVSEAKAEARYVVEAGVLSFRSGTTFQNEQIGNIETQEIVLDAGSEIKIKGRVSMHAKRIVILGLIDGDFPVFLNKEGYQAEQSFLELNAEQDLDVGGIIFLRHYYKNLEHQVSLLPSYTVRAMDQDYRLKLSARKISVRGLISLSQNDLSPFGANVWVNAIDWKNSFVSASSFDRAENVDFNHVPKQQRSAAR